MCKPIVLQYRNEGQRFCKMRSMSNSRLLFPWLSDIGRQIRRPVFLDRKPEGRKIRRRNIRIRKCGVDPPSGTNTHEAVTLWPLVCGASTRTSDPCCGVQTLPMLGQSATQDATTAWLDFIQIETVIKWYKQNPSLRCRDTVSEKLWAISSPRIHKHC